MISSASTDLSLNQKVYRALKEVPIALCGTILLMFSNTLRVAGSLSPDLMKGDGNEHS
jgi:hypothetical protein